MSLLWTQAMAWHNDDREDEDEEMLGDVRDKRPYHERRPDLVKHIAFVHGVSHEQADSALESVEHGLSKDGGRSLHGSPIDYGFANVTRPHERHSDTHFSPEVEKAVKDARVWKQYGHVEPVDTDNIRATQGWVRHAGVAHNLFHPGLRAPFQEGVEGDPDYDPEWDEESHDEIEQNREHERQSGDLDPARDYDSSHVHIYEDEHGTPHVIDGHHRVAADTALQKPETRGRVLRSERDEHGNLVHSWDPKHHDDLCTDPSEHL